MREHRWEDALPILLEDIEANPRDPWSPMYLGSCYYELQDYQAALDWFRRAEQLEPENPTPIGLQGDALHCLGDADEARELYLRALEVAPDDELAIKNWKRFNQIEQKAEQTGRGNDDKPSI
ncbi:tetratricopeptide repeat protein [Phragmitibacter flavus]|nr:tetratricopeptide repeat protein [Phragmitibacter flavus]